MSKRESKKSERGRKTISLSQTKSGKVDRSPARLEQGPLGVPRVNVPIFSVVQERCASSILAFNRLAAQRNTGVASELTSSRPSNPGEGNSHEHDALTGSQQLPQTRRQIQPVSNFVYAPEQPQPTTKEHDCKEAVQQQVARTESCFCYVGAEESEFDRLYH